MCTERILRLALAAAMTLILPGETDAQQTDTKAAEVIASARKALGGEQRLAAVKTLSLKASYRRELPAPSGGGHIVMAGPGGESAQMAGEIEIDVALPDKYIKVDTSSGMVAITRTEGFDGDKPLMSVQANSPHVRIMDDNPAADPARAKVAVTRARADVARLLLGMTAGAPPGFDVTYSYVGQAESPDGKADVIEVKGPDGFATRLFIDTQTHLPLMLTYIAAEPRVIRRTMGGPGGPPPDGSVVRPEGRRRTLDDLTPGEREKLEQERKALEAEPQKMIEFRVFFSDYREVGGVSLPHRIVRGTATTTTEEWEVKTYKVNPSINADRFTVS